MGGRGRLVVTIEEGDCRGETKGERRWKMMRRDMEGDEDSLRRKKKGGGHKEEPRNGRERKKEAETSKRRGGGKEG